MTGLVGERRAADIVCLDFSKASDTLPRKILIDKPINYGLDEQSVKWIEIWLNSLSKRVAIGDVKAR